MCGVFAASVSVSAGADALLEEPLALSERAPLTQRFNLPAMRSGSVLAEGGVQWRAGVDIANNFVRARHGTEALLLDGEMQRYELGLRYGLGAGWEIGALLPWVAHNGGALDNFIEDWHDLWGLPDGERLDHATGRLQYAYQRHGRTELNFADADTGFGDVQLQIANQLLQTSRDNVALIVSVNLPVGDDKKLTGAGGTSAGILVAATHAEWLGLPLTLTGNIGAQSLPRGDALDEWQKESVWFGSGEIAWAVAQKWRLRAQVNAHSAVYDSELTALGATSVQLLLGGSVRLSPHWVLDAAVGEDIEVDSAPDVTLQLALKARY